MRNVDKRRRLQSAMEYLMTYGWSILIIAVVLAALYSLGIFGNGTISGPKIPPGSCQVYRPYGPRTTGSINFEGTCSNEFPEYAAVFNGATSSIITPLVSTAASVTMSIWVDPIGITGSSQQQIFYNGNFAGGYGLVLESTSTCYQAGFGVEIYLSNSNCNVGGFPLPTISPNTWTFLTLTKSGSTWVLYINGVQSASGSAGAIAPVADTSMGSGVNVGGGLQAVSFNGLLSNAQFYNTTFSANDVIALYDEGIGGVPTEPGSLVAWWPLNGNGNDYGGDLNNGIAGNVVYTTGWTSAYAPA